MQYRVLDAARVLVDWHPVGLTLIEHRLVAVRAGITTEVPGRFDECVECVRLTMRRIFHTSDNRLRKTPGISFNGDPVPVNSTSSGRYNRQLILRHRLRHHNRRSK